MIPAPWVALVLALGVYRVFRLIGWDDFPPIAKLRARAVGEHVYYNTTESRDGPLYRYRRPVLNHFLNCPFCFGFWLSLLVYVLWLFVPTEVLYGLAPFALSGAVGIVASKLDG